jgi:hypothetical protein
MPGEPDAAKSWNQHCDGPNAVGELVVRAQLVCA